MIDFELTPADQEILRLAHEQALIGRRYARYYDQHDDELPPDEFPEAAKLPDVTTLASEGVSGSSGARILHSLVMLEINWRNRVTSREVGTGQHGAGDGRFARANRKMEKSHDCDRDHRAGCRFGSREHPHHGDL